MKHIIESLGLANLKTKIVNSFNRYEVHFNNPVIYINKQTMEMNEKLNSVRKIKKLNN